MRALGALVVASARYWTSVAPLVRSELSHWEQRALEIPDPALRDLASGKLRVDRFNIEVAATLATLAPREHRASAVRAIVALQVMYDYLDSLTEEPLPDPPRDGRRLFEAMLDAIDLDSSSPREDAYLAELVQRIRPTLSRLPAWPAVAEIARHSGERCAQAQILNHAAADLGVTPLREWATREAVGSGLQWQEFLAGSAASVLAIHALIAAAADRRTTREDARAIDAAYLSIGALTMLDSVVDYREDLERGRPGFVQYYGGPGPLARRLPPLAREASTRARALPHAPHHVMTVTGIVAYYASAPSARAGFARSIFAPVRGELRPLIGPTVAVMRTWRAAKP